MDEKIVLNPKYLKLWRFVKSVAHDGVDPDATLIYKARNCVYTQVFDGIALNIKAFRQPKFPNNYIYTNLRQSKAKRSYHNALHLKQMGFDTPDPVAYIEIKRGGRLLRSYYISRQIEASDFRLWADRGPSFTPVLEQLAQYMAKLHAAGVYHKDFSPGNILYTLDENGQAHFYLIDLNRMQFDVYSHNKQMRNFSAIYIESRDETARLARMYARCIGDNSEKIAAQALKQFDRRARKKRQIQRIKKLSHL